VGTSHTISIAFTVDLDVLHMTLLKFLHSFLNVFHATLCTHLLGGDVGVEASAIPVTRDWLRLEGDLGAKFFRNTVKEPSGDPELVTDC